MVLPVYLAKSCMHSTYNFSKQEIRTFVVPNTFLVLIQLEVTFRVDANGILSVKAVAKNTGKHEELTIDREERAIDENQLQEMLRKAEVRVALGVAVRMEMAVHWSSRTKYF